MASWEDLKTYIRKNYKIKDQEENLISLVFDLQNFRSQQIFIQKLENNDGEVWVKFVSPIGKLSSEDLDETLESLGDKLCRGMIKIGDTYFISHSIQIDDLSTSNFKRGMHIVMNMADAFERKYIGEDEN